MQQDLFINDDFQVLLSDRGTVELYRSFLGGESYFNLINEECIWHELDINLYGKTHKVPRLTAWFADDVTKEYSYSGINLTPVTWTKSLLKLKTRIEEKIGMKFNSCLVNLYRNGADYVAWHSDDERELGKRPVIASLSLGETISIDLSDGDLLVMKDDLQMNWKHQLNKTSKNVGPTINLTFRNLF